MSLPVRRALGAGLTQSGGAVRRGVVRTAQAGLLEQTANQRETASAAGTGPAPVGDVALAAGTRQDVGSDGVIGDRVLQWQTYTAQASVRSNGRASSSRRMTTGTPASASSAAVRSVTGCSTTRRWPTPTTVADTWVGSTVTRTQSTRRSPARSVGRPIRLP